ncbi:hypothetical protein BT96DRAFT_413991 [Gymnopus androsaceus JB14]|uniref:Uncharacterized protein n=1 Tax=Gymnopus androsaceus JB14 TaxID=1447944 RepID=A0A6A4GUL9_9AGAR|nr:hypothetical protein BT96DRAFT_413991 [Gymnopus androsaceus JB14]
MLNQYIDLEAQFASDDEFSDVEGFEDSTCYTWLFLFRITHSLFRWIHRRRPSQQPRTIFSNLDILFFYSSPFINSQQRFGHSFSTD